MREIAKEIPDISSLNTYLQGIFWTAFYDRYKARPTGIQEDFSRLAKVLLNHTFESPLRAEIKSLYPDIAYYIPDVSNLTLPVSLHEGKRFEHTWICAKHGSGKTTLIENLIHHDLQKVKYGKATVLIMDSQGKNELLGRIDETFPCMTIDTSTPLNIFAAPRRPKDAREAEILYTNQIDLITYVFSTTLGDGGGFTPKQRTLFTYLVQFVMMAEGTVADMLKLLLPKGIEPYRSVIPRLSPPAQLFFTTQFDDPKQYVDTKKEIHWRLDAILSTEKKMPDTLHWPQTNVVPIKKRAQG